MVSCASVSRPKGTRLLSELCSPSSRIPTKTSTQSLEARPLRLRLLHRPRRGKPRRLAKVRSREARRIRQLQIREKARGKVLFRSLHLNRKAKRRHRHSKSLAVRPRHPRLRHRVPPHRPLCPHVQQHRVRRALRPDLREEMVLRVPAPPRPGDGSAHHLSHADSRRKKEFSSGASRALDRVAASSSVTSRTPKRRPARRGQRPPNDWLPKAITRTCRLRRSGKPSRGGFPNRMDRFRRSSSPPSS